MKRGFIALFIFAVLIGSIAFIAGAYSQEQLGQLTKMGAKQIHFCFKCNNVNNTISINTGKHLTNGETICLDKNYNDINEIILSQTEAINLGYDLSNPLNYTLLINNLIKQRRIGCGIIGFSDPSALLEKNRNGILDKGEELLGVYALKSKSSLIIEGKKILIQKGAYVSYAKDILKITNPTKKNIEIKLENSNIKTLYSEASMQISNGKIKIYATWWNYLKYWFNKDKKTEVIWGNAENKKIKPYNGEITPSKKSIPAQSTAEPFKKNAPNYHPTNLEKCISQKLESNMFSTSQNARDYCKSINQ